MAEGRQEGGHGGRGGGGATSAVVDGENGGADVGQGAEAALSLGACVLGRNAGGDQVGAALATALLFWTPMCLFQNTANYATTFVAQYTGAGRPRRVGPIIWQSLYFRAAGGAVFLAMGPLAETLLAPVGPPSHIPAPAWCRLTLPSLPAPHRTPHPPLTPPAGTATVQPEASAPPTEPTTSSNFFVRNFRAGGPIMWPILLVSIAALFVVIDRCVWWGFRWFRRDPKRVEKVFTALESGDVNEASKLARGTRDPVLRMIWNGLNHQHSSLQGALQVAAGIEIKRAGHYLVVMDTLVTLAPLLGLLGTITGLMKSFSLLGSEELAVQAVTGGIAGARIATAAGLATAMFGLVSLNNS